MKQLTLNFKERIGRLLKPARPAKDTESGVLTQAERAFFLAKQRAAIGRWAEELAAGFLQAQGLKILERNVRERFSELDLVALEGNVLVFVEVRCRRKNPLMSAQDSIGPLKWKRLVRGAELYTLRRRWRGEWRMDLVSVDVDHERWHLRWLRYLEMEGADDRGC
ncbi:MAG: YraN family protein [Pyramidobacter sp.]|uniref:YraN family protein n=1 Tax=Pyramidobacter sp. TaxID=1943581 RepID=UPI002A808662|nr:YraN family protein [Pyramidobacter sp.]MDY4033546.1 YraN family protein [Pyramidobacter sp.]